VSKVAIIGAGNVGATCAQRILEHNLADVVLIDKIKGLAEGKALDLAQASSLENHSRKIDGGDDFSKIKGSDIVVITAGLPRMPGETRAQLIEKNSAIVKAVAQNVKKYASDSIVIVVTNPLDSMSYLTYKLTGFDRKKVLGMAGILDTARFKYFVSQETGFPQLEIDAIVLGGHADTMVPLPRVCEVAERPLEKVMTKEEIDAAIEKTKNGGAQIVSLLKMGSAFYAPASSVKCMVDAILNDKKTVSPVSVYLQGEYGIKDIFCGVPVILGKNGMEKIVELDLAQDEKKVLNVSADKIRQEIDLLKNII